MKVRTTVSLLAAAAILFFGALRVNAMSDVVDRIVATVNGHVILQSELDEELRYEAILSGRQPSDFTEDEKKAALDRLIDQELLAEQMATSAFARCSEPEAESKIAESRKQSANESDGAWQAALNQFHLSEKDVVAHVRRQVDLSRLVEARLRPAVQIDTQSVEAYYREKFVPQLQKAGTAKVALDDVSDKIRDLLTEEKVNELLVSWLHTLRSEGDVKVNDQASSAQEMR